MGFLVIAVLDGSDLLNPLNASEIDVRPGFVRTQNEIAPMFLPIPSFAEMDVAVVRGEFSHCIVYTRILFSNRYLLWTDTRL